MIASSGGEGPNRESQIRTQSGQMKKSWKKPKVVEIAVGLEINSYACAELKK
jgi:coenzyme PQQ precursor peptide PqqA